MREKQRQKCTKEHCDWWSRSAMVPERPHCRRTLSGPREITNHSVSPPPLPPPGMTHGIHQADTDECGGRTALIEMFPLPNAEKGVRNMNVEVRACEPVYSSVRGAGCPWASLR